VDAIILPPPPAPSHRGFWIALAVSGVVYLSLFFIGGEAENFANAGLTVLPFVFLALLAYSAADSPAVKVTTVLYVLGLIGCVGLVEMGAVLLPAIRNPNWIPGMALPRTVLAQLLMTFLGVTVAALLAGLYFLPGASQVAARFFPIQPNSFVHTTALATVLGLTVAFFVPLLVLPEPLIVMLLKQPGLREEIGDSQRLRDQIYTLAWQVPVAFLLVGYPLRRSLNETRKRLGLFWPSPLQLLFAVVAVVVLIGLMAGVDNGINWLWKRLGWLTTDETAMSDLFKFATNPLGALVVGVAAGLGEELAVRGVLQPRLGIVLSNLFFTALHAWQYHFDALLSVFLLGLILGVIRQRTNTTTSAIVHGGYDFLALLLVYLEVEVF
jgi:membrane protease YdiL (CAAX protease family)